MIVCRLNLLNNDTVNFFLPPFMPINTKLFFFSPSNLNVDTVETVFRITANTRNQSQDQAMAQSSHFS